MSEWLPMVNCVLSLLILVIGSLTYRIARAERKARLQSRPTISFGTDAVFVARDGLATLHKGET